MITVLGTQQRILLQEPMQDRTNSPSAHGVANGHPSATTKSQDQSPDLIEKSAAISLTPFPCLTGLRPTTITGATSNVSIETDLVFQDLHDAVQRMGASPAAAIQAAWAALLFVYTDAKDCVVFSAIVTEKPPGHPADSRRHAAIRRTCVFRSEDLATKDSSALLQQTRQLHSAGIGLEKTLPRREPNNNPQRNTTELVINYNEQSNFAKPSASNWVGPPENGVSIDVSTSPHGLLQLRATFTDATLKANAAHQTLRQLTAVLRSLLYIPDKPITDALAAVDISLLSISDPKSSQLGSIGFLQSQFECYARSTPDQVALDFRIDLQDERSDRNIRWTYRALNERAEDFANYLHYHYGWLADKVVPICMDRCPEIFTAILGILKAGGAWCPIDPSYPQKRRHDLIARTGAQMLVSTRDTIDGLPAGVSVINVTKANTLGSKRPSPPPVNAYNLAYLIWTSGTTGKPKGVPISIGAAVTAMKSLQTAIPTEVHGGVVRCLQFSQFTFDVFVQDMFYTWGVGGTLIASDLAIMLGSFVELATKTKATHAHLTPAFAASLPRDHCPTLEVITMIGEKLTQNVADDWGRDMRAFNTYGPAETTVVSTLRQFGGPEDPVQSANVGFPLPSVTVAVLQNGKPIMTNGIGELALGGPQLSQGYWKDPDKTAERFVWSEELGMTLYMTGDVVRMLHDKTLEFVGRTDDLVKIQGIRVELSEIAFSLRACHALVQQVEIQYLNRPDRPSKVIVAFLAVPELGNLSASIETSDLALEIGKAAKEEAKENLPDYMIPHVFLVLGSIPRTPSNKIDRAVLKNLYASVDLGSWESQLASDADQNPEWTERELAILHTIEQLTGTSRDAMGRSSTLPSVGIDSISTTRLVTKLNSEGFDLSRADVLTCPDLGRFTSLAYKQPTHARLEKFDTDAFHEQWSKFLTPMFADKEAFVTPALPLQESLLTESIQSARSYWSSNSFSLDASVDLQKLHNAWKQVALHNEALRASFMPVANLQDHPDCDATFLQVILKQPILDWTHVESADPEQARHRATDIAQRHQRENFASPPWAVTIFFLGEKRVMMLTIHHAIRDEPSLGFIMDDLHRAYTDSTSDQATASRQQFTEAVSLLQPSLDQKQEDATYWTKLLSEYGEQEDPNSLPVLTNDNSSSGSFVHTWVMKRSYQDLQREAVSAGASSVASTLRLAWSLILLEYLETDKVVIGETWSARSEAAALADVIGPLISVIPFPFKRSGTAREAMTYQAGFQTESKSHYGVHPKVMRRVLGRSDGEPTYTAIFNFIPDMDQDKSGKETSLWKQMDNVVGLSVEHPLALNASMTSAGKLSLELVASKQFFDRPHLDILFKQIEGCTYTLLADPDMLLSETSPRLPKDLLSISHGPSTGMENPAWSQSPMHWVDHFAETHPNWIAAEVASRVEESGVTSKKWTYEELLKAYRTIVQLIKGFQCKGGMIAVCLERRLDVYAILLGIHGSGNTYLPIAEDLPSERKSFMLKDSNAAMLFTSKALQETFETVPSQCHTMLVDDLRYPTVAIPIELAPAQPTDNAYLLYTSGSTGAPKGVLVSRGNLTSFTEADSNFICSYVPEMSRLEGKGKYLGLASYAFDVHLKEMFTAWRHGMCAVTAPRSLLLDNLELALRKLRITHASFVPSLIDSLGIEPSTLPNLKYLTVGGEKISQHVIDTWAGNPWVTLVNAYGPTEATIGCCFQKVERRMNVRNVGPPLSYTIAHVLQPGTLSYTLRGTAGELCITGDLVANGYLNRPDAKGFVDDFHGQRMYQTGDRVRLMADGSLEFLGRDDDQTKVRGQRLELGEVTEAVRVAAAAVLKVDKIDAVAIVTQHASMAKPQLVVFLASRQTVNGEQPALSSFPDDRASGEILSACQKLLPAFMVPDHIIPITRLPAATISRKVDAKRLKALFSDIAIDDLLSNKPAQETGDRPLNETEKVIANTASITLNVKDAKIGPLTNLFQLGLDSLSAISVTIKLQKLGFKCSVTDVLKRPVVQGLALLPRKDTASKSVETASKKIADLESRFRHHYRHGPLMGTVAAIRPCLPLQETLVASSLTRDRDALYINHVKLRISNLVDKDRLKRAWQSTIANHEILRTVFRNFEGRVVQIVFKEHDFDWTEIHVTDSVSQDSTLKQLEGERGEEIDRAIHRKPPFRLALATSRSGQAYATLLVSIHHGLYDGESFPMILDEVYAHYQSLPSNSRTHFSELLRHIYAQNPEDAKSFWTKYLEGYKPNSLQVPSSLNMTIENQRKVSVSLSHIEAFASSINGTPASLLQAIFGIILAQYLQRRDVVFGAVYSGRTVPIDNPHSILAPCITTIPQRVHLKQAHSSVTDVLTAAQAGFVESLDYQHTSLRDIHRWVKAEKSLFNCLFSYVRKRNCAEWEKLWWEVESNMPSEFPFNVEVEADGERDEAVARCVFRSQDVRLGDVVLENMNMLLAALVKGETVQVKDLGIGDTSLEGNETEKYDEINWDPQETTVRDEIAKMTSLPSETIKKATSFFSLGIDSISAIKLVQKLRQQSGLECSSADIMRYPNIGLLVRHINSNSSTNADRHDIVARPEFDEKLEGVVKLTPEDDIITTYPCTPLQASMLTRTLSSADGKMYVHHHVRLLNPEVDLERLRDAWKELAVRTEILRTAFHYHEDSRSWNGAVHKISDVECEKLDGNGNMDAVLKKIQEDSSFRRAEDYGRQLPWKVGLVGNWMVISMHHALYDGEALGMLLKDLSQLYERTGATYKQEQSLLAAGPAFSVAAKEIASTASGKEDFWLRQIEGSQGIDAVEPDQPSKEARRTLKLPVNSVIQRCKHLGVTLQSAALLAYGKSLACTLERRDLVFGHVVGGRTLSMRGVNDVVGPLFNTVPFRFKLDKIYATNKAAVNSIQDFIGKAQVYQHASLSKIQREWKSKTAGAGGELFNAIFLFQQPAVAEIAELWSIVDDVLEGENKAEYPINFEIEQRDQQISVLLASSIISNIPAWLDRYEQILYDILDQPNRSVVGFPNDLAALPLDTSSSQPESTPPSSAEEAISSGPDLDAIRNALSKASNLPAMKITNDTTIFSLGLDSISAIQVASICQKQGLGLSVADVLQGRSVVGICKFLREKQKLVTTAPTVQNSRDEPAQSLVSENTKAAALKLAGLKAEQAQEQVEEILPCLAGQVYHLASWLKSGRTMREGIFAYRCRRPLDSSKLRSAWEELRKRHVVLRTTFFATSSNKAVQVIFKSGVEHADAFETIAVELASEEVVSEIFKREADRRFDMFTPPVKLILAQSSEGGVVLMKLHHAVYDAWTVHKLVDDLAALYQGNPLSPPPDVRDFICHTTISSQNPSHRDYWRSTLQHAESTLLRSRSSSTPQPTTSPLFSLRNAIPNLSTLESHCQAHSISLPTLILIAFARALATHTATANPVFGLYRTGRAGDVPGAQEVGFPCVNVLPFVVRSAVSLPAQGLTEAVQTDLARGVQHEQTLLHDVCDWAGWEGAEFDSCVNIIWRDGDSSVEGGNQEGRDGDGGDGAGEGGGEGAEGGGGGGGGGGAERTQEGMFKPWYPPATGTRLEDLLPIERKAGKTPIDGLDTTFLPQENFFLDVVRNAGRDNIEVSVRCDSGVMAEAEAREFVAEVRRRVEGVVGELET